MNTMKNYFISQDMGAFGVHRALCAFKAPRCKKRILWASLLQTLFSLICPITRELVLCTFSFSSVSPSHSQECILKNSSPFPFFFICVSYLSVLICIHLYSFVFKRRLNICISFFIRVGEHNRRLCATLGRHIKRTAVPNMLWERACKLKTKKTNAHTNT